MVLESKAIDKTLRSEIIERAPFTCDFRKWKFLKRVSSDILYFGFCPMPVEIESTDVGKLELLTMKIGR
jgi:hypothetical protein